ncbi:MAG: NADP oxidoreductase [Anaerolineae bacterium]
MSRKRMATVWLDGCSGCHMSFLDIDERLLALADQIELVYSPLVDRKDFPPDVDITLVEGSVSSEHDMEKIRHIRERTQLLVSLGDCAVNGNVPSMRNSLSVESVLRRVYLDPGLHNPALPNDEVPRLLPLVRPVHTVVPVDVFIPGCPPRADVIFWALTELLAGRKPDLIGRTRFGV